MDKILNLDSVDLYNKLYGLETLNPLVSVIDLNKATSSVDLIRFNYGIYALYLKLRKPAISNTDARHTITKKARSFASPPGKQRKQTRPPIKSK